MFGSIASAITGFLQHNNNPLGLFLLGLSSLLEYVFPPFPGDTVTLFGAFLVTRYGWNLPLVFAVTLLGSGLGAMIDFTLGVWMGRRYAAGRFLAAPAARRRVEQVTASFRRYGEAFIALNRFLPAVRAVFFLAAGMAGLRPGRVLIFSLISAALWNAVILGVGYGVGANWARIREIFSTYSAVAWCLCGAVLVGWGIRWALRRRRARSDDEGQREQSSR